MIERLQQKLALADFPHDAADFDGSSWDLGPPAKEIQRLADVWHTEYSWRNVEAELNKLSHFTVPITVDSLRHTFDIHFVHERSPRADAIPLLFLHGWPGSFIEVTKIIERLVHGQDDEGTTGVSFHVVAPSLVDFGFSSRSTVRVQAEYMSSRNRSECPVLSLLKVGIVVIIIEWFPFSTPCRGISQTNASTGLRALR